MARLVPFKVGMQVSRCDHSERSTPGDVWSIATANRMDAERVVSAVWCREPGGAQHGGSCSHMFEHSAEVQRFAHDCFFERQKCGSDSSGDSEGATDDGIALLGERVLR